MRKQAPLHRSPVTGDKSPVHKLFIWFLTICFFLSTEHFSIIPAYADSLIMPKPGVMVHLSPPANPAILKGIKVDPKDPFRFEFILDRGELLEMGHESGRKDESWGKDSPTQRPKTKLMTHNQELILKVESTRLIKYFLASITVPEKDLWVNLSPYEKDRIIPNSFGLTEMGRDLLAEDYMLKQITASLIYPEDEVGKKFWKRIYEESQAKYGTTNVPVNTFNKVWIVPEKAVVYENAKVGTAYVVESRLKVMLAEDYEALAKSRQNENFGGLEEDYLALEKNTVTLSEAKGLNEHKDSSSSRKSGTPQNDTGKLGSQIIREIVIPELTREINEGANFAKLRQVYNSLILATWYKKKIKDSNLSQVYADKNKIEGIGYQNIRNSNIRIFETRSNTRINQFPKRFENLNFEELKFVSNIRTFEDSRLTPEKIYNNYLLAFKKGVYNYIKVEVDPAAQITIPRKYFSGGLTFNLDKALTVTDQVPINLIDSAMKVTVNLAMETRGAGVDYAMSNSPSGLENQTVLNIQPRIISKFKKTYRLQRIKSEVRSVLGSLPQLDLLFKDNQMRRRNAQTLVSVLKLIVPEDSPLITFFQENVVRGTTEENYYDKVPIQAEIIAGTTALLSANLPLLQQEEAALNFLAVQYSEQLTEAPSEKAYDFLKLLGHNLASSETYKKANEILDKLGSSFGLTAVEIESIKSRIELIEGKVPVKQLEIKRKDKGPLDSTLENYRKDLVRVSLVQLVGADDFIERAKERALIQLQDNSSVGFIHVHSFGYKELIFINLQKDDKNYDDDLRNVLVSELGHLIHFYFLGRDTYFKIPNPVDSGVTEMYDYLASFSANPEVLKKARDSQFMGPAYEVLSSEPLKTIKTYSVDTREDKQMRRELLPKGVYYQQEENRTFAWMRADSDYLIDRLSTKIPRREVESKLERDPRSLVPHVIGQYLAVQLVELVSGDINKAMRLAGLMLRQKPEVWGLDWDSCLAKMKEVASSQEFQNIVRKSSNLTIEEKPKYKAMWIDDPISGKDIQFRLSKNEEIDGVTRYAYLTVEDREYKSLKSSTTRFVFDIEERIISIRINGEQSELIKTREKLSEDNIDVPYFSQEVVTTKGFSYLVIEKIKGKKLEEYSTLTQQQQEAMLRMVSNLIEKGWIIKDISTNLFWDEIKERVVLIDVEEAIRVDDHEGIQLLDDMSLHRYYMNRLLRYQNARFFYESLSRAQLGPTEDRAMLIEDQLVKSLDKKIVLPEGLRRITLVLTHRGASFGNLAGLELLTKSIFNRFEGAEISLAFVHQDKNEEELSELRNRLKILGIKNIKAKFYNDEQAVPGSDIVIYYGGRGVSLSHLEKNDYNIPSKITFHIPIYSEDSNIVDPLLQRTILGRDGKPILHISLPTGNFSNPYTNLFIDKTLTKRSLEIRHMDEDEVKSQRWELMQELRKFRNHGEDLVDQNLTSVPWGFAYAQDYVSLLNYVSNIEKNYAQQEKDVVVYVIPGSSMPDDYLTLLKDLSPRIHLVFLERQYRYKDLYNQILLYSGSFVEVDGKRRLQGAFPVLVTGDQSFGEAMSALKVFVHDGYMAGMIRGRGFLDNYFGKLIPRFEERYRTSKNDHSWYQLFKADPAKIQEDFDDEMAPVLISQSVVDHMGDLILENKSKAYQAMKTNTGGIDFIASKTQLEVRNSAEAINFKIDAVKLEQLRNSAGFYPVIIGIEPLKDLKRFLGINSTKSTGEVIA